MCRPKLWVRLVWKKVTFEAADPNVLAWYIKNYRPELKSVVDPGHIVRLECLPSGIWGTADVWGRILTYKGSGRTDDSGRESAAEAVCNGLPCQGGGVP